MKGERWAARSAHPTTWRFLTARPIPARPDLGGTEQAILNLLAALEGRGHQVALGQGAPADITVAINDASLLPEGARCPVVWFHNEVLLWREVRRGRWPALWRHRPHAVFCGARQARQASFLLPFQSRFVLPHGLPTGILAAEPAAGPPPPHAVFISQAYRGLADLIRLWMRRILPAIPAARFSAFIAPGDIAAYKKQAGCVPSIAILPREPNAAMPGVLRSARVLLAPGHRSETFCLAAAEAIAMGVPVVTFGIGALGERVHDGETGFVCASKAAFAQRTRALLTDDALWDRQHARGLATRRDIGWDRVAIGWEAHFDRRA